MPRATKNLLIAPSSHLQIAKKQIASLCPGEEFSSVSSEAFVSELRGRITRLLPRFRRYDRTAYFADDLGSGAAGIWRPMVWWLARRGFLFDSDGNRVDMSLGSVFGDAARGSLEIASVPFLFMKLRRDLALLSDPGRPALHEAWKVAYLRTDFWFGKKSGGSVTHVAGVANAFVELGVPLFFLSSDHLELIDENRTPIIRVAPQAGLRLLPEVPLMAYNSRFITEGIKAFSERQPTIVYQRASLFNYSGAFLAARHRVPFVLEYNGSESWVARNWGSPLRYPEWADRIEDANLRAAEAITVVSKPLRQELISRGVPEAKILVNANGVDIERFDPGQLHRQREIIRSRFGLSEKTVVGFIGTFGAWHGAEMLAQAVAPVVAHCPDVHFLLIGDGVRMAETRRVVSQNTMDDYVTFTGLVPQEAGPAYLSACDILVSPHVPNPDGSAFFGSPTKLFEYMAMGKGIVASRLGQIAEVLEDRSTALMVEPGSVRDLAAAIQSLVNDPELRLELGRNARRRAVAEHTWLAHTQRIIDHLRDLYRC